MRKPPTPILWNKKIPDSLSGHAQLAAGLGFIAKLGWLARGSPNFDVHLFDKHQKHETMCLAKQGLFPSFIQY